MLTASFTKFRVRTQNVSADNWVLDTSSLIEEEHTLVKWGHIGHMMSPTSMSFPFQKPKLPAGPVRRNRGEKGL